MDTDYGELKTLIKVGAIPIVVDGIARECPNCHGVSEVYVFSVAGGPFRYPPLGKDKAGTKWLDDADHRPGWYTGRIEATPCPICQSGHKAEYLWRISGLTDADKNTTIEDFRDLRGKEKARQAAIDLLAMNQSPYGFLTLWGSFGVGKSMLLKCLVNGFRLIGLLAHYTTLADLLATVREKFGEGSGSVEAAIDYYRAIPVLAMDEIDRVNMTPWATETTYRLLDSRFNSRDELVTVIACNLSPLQLPAEFGYLASRMRGGQVVEVGGADLRPAIALKERKDIDG